MRALSEIASALNALPAVDAVRRTIIEQGGAASLTGSAVRDLYLESTPVELTFLVDADARTCARRVATLAPGGIGIATPSGTFRYLRTALGDVEFVSTLGRPVEQVLADAVDVSVNTLAVDLRSGTVLDVHGGLPDMMSGIIRWPSARHGRTMTFGLALRALRTAVLVPRGTLEAATRKAIADSRAAGAEACPEDVGFELHMLLKSPRSRCGVRLLDELGLLEEISRRFLPSLTPGASSDPEALDRTLRAFSALDILAAPYATLAAAYLPTLRDVLLVTCTPHGYWAELTSEAIRRLLVASGPRIETTFNRLSASYACLGIYGFRVRLLTAAYATTMVALRSHALSPVDALKRARTIFGPVKGLLASLLVAADLLADHNDEAAVWLGLERAFGGGQGQSHADVC